MTSTPINILLTGATGYIGGSFLHKLLEGNKTDRRFHVTALVRSKEAAAKLAEIESVTPLLGSLDDADLLTHASDAADVVLNFADADNIGALTAISAGLARRRKENPHKRRGILIHTSGTGVLADDAWGQHGRQEPLSDLDMAAINAIPLSQIHRNVDQLIFERAGEASDPDFDAYIVCPPDIYGRGLGLFNRYSMKVPALIRAFVGNGKVATVGEGVNIWDSVHIEDLVDLYILLLDKALEGSANKGREGGYYFAESGQFSMKDLSDRLAVILHNRGAIASDQVVQLDVAEALKFFPVPEIYIRLTSGNSRSRADRSRLLGWTPRAVGDMFASLEGDVDFVLTQQKQ